MGYVLILFVVAVLAVCSIPVTGLPYPEGATYEVVSIEYATPGKRCTLKNVVDGSLVLCEWNQFKDIYVGDILVCIDKRLEKLGR